MKEEPVILSIVNNLLLTTALRILQSVNECLPEFPKKKLIQGRTFCFRIRQPLQAIVLRENFSTLSPLSRSLSISSLTVPFLLRLPLFGIVVFLALQLLSSMPSLKTKDACYKANEILETLEGSGL
jgi:hypothetical protein